MKPYFLIFTFFQLSTFLSFSQVNTYFENNPVWHVETASYSGWDCSGSIDSYNYYMEGDTIIDTLTYKKIFRQGVVTLINSSCQPYDNNLYINQTPSFFLRSFNKKMYIYRPEDQFETLLYDFNLTIGDTLPETYTYNPSNSSYLMIVESIDSVSTPNGYLKKFALSGGNLDTLYEGIGSTGGLEESIFPLFLSGSHQLRCYSLNNSSYVPTISSSTCYITVGIPDLSNKNEHKVFPNPFSSKMEIQLNSEVNDAELTIFTPNGLKVKTIVFSGNRFNFEREELNAGMYYYQIKPGDANSLTGKFVIVD